MPDVPRFPGPGYRGPFLLAAAFLTAMVAFFSWHDAFRDVGPDLLRNGDFEQPVAAGTATAVADPLGGPWLRHGAGARWVATEGRNGSGALRLDAIRGIGCSAEYVLYDLRGLSELRISGWLRLDHVTRARHDWSYARLLLFFTDAAGEPHWDVPHNACLEDGTHGWHRCEAVIAVPSFATAAHVFVQNAGSSGSLWADDIRLVPAELKASQAWWRALFATLWALVALGGTIRARLWARPFGIAVLATALAIVLGVTLPEGAVETIARGGVHAIIAPFASPRSPVKPHPADTVTPPAPTTSSSPAPAAKPAGPAQAAPVVPPPGLIPGIKKSAHVVLFAVLGGLAAASVLRTRRRSGPTSPGRDAAAAAIVAVVLFAAGSEALQFLSPTRMPRVADVLLDLGGAAAGAALTFLAARRRAG